MLLVGERLQGHMTLQSLTNEQHVPDRRVLYRRFERDYNVLCSYCWLRDEQNVQLLIDVGILV